MADHEFLHYCKTKGPRTEIWNVDCLEGLSYFEGDADLVFADPPFNIGQDYEGDATEDDRKWGDYCQWTAEWLRLACGALKTDGSLWVNVPDAVAVSVIQACEAWTWELEDWCIWHYRFGQCTDAHFIRSKTHLLHFTSRYSHKPKWYPDQIREPSVRQEMGDKRAKSEGRVPMDVWYGENMGRVQGNNKERRPLHPNQLPEKLLERIILSCTKEGDLVVDPFLGSGTTCVVARALGRESVGIEKSAAYCESAWERLKKGAVRV